MKLDLAISNILLGDLVEGQIDGLVHEARRRVRRQQTKSLLQKFLDTGWKGKTGLAVAAAGLTYGSYKAYKYLERKGEGMRSEIQEAIYQGLQELWSGDTVAKVAEGNLTEWKGAVRRAIKNANIPLVGPLVSCVVDIVIGIFNGGKGKKPKNKKELEKQAKKTFDENDDKVASSKRVGSSDILTRRLNERHPNNKLEQDRILQILWNEGKKYKLDLYGIIFLYMNPCEDDPRHRRAGRFINLDGVSPKALGQAFMSYLGKDYSAPANQNLRWSH